MSYDQRETIGRSMSDFPVTGVLVAAKDGVSKAGKPYSLAELDLDDGRSVTIFTGRAHGQVAGLAAGTRIRMTGEQNGQYVNIAKVEVLEAMTGHGGAKGAVVPVARPNGQLVSKEQAEGMIVWAALMTKSAGFKQDAAGAEAFKCILVLAAKNMDPELFGDPDGQLTAEDIPF